METTFDSPSAPDTYTADLRVGYLFGKTWGIYKEHLGLVVGASALYMLLAVLLSGGNTWGLGAGVSGLSNVLWLVIGGPLTVGLYGIMLRTVRREDAAISNLFDGFQHFGRAFGVYVLYLIAVFVGILLLVVPGVIVAIGLFPALYLVYDERLGVTETLQRAWELTRGHKFELFILGVVVMLLNLLGLIALFIGAIFTGAFTYLLGAAVYEELSLEAA